LLFFWLQNVELAIARVRQRVREGGHDIPENTIRRRYRNGILNLFDIYLPIADEAFIFDNSDEKCELIAEKNNESSPIKIYLIENFSLLKQVYYAGKI
jgi:predicted ABC-type ATPase